MERKKGFSEIPMREFEPFYKWHDVGTDEEKQRALNDAQHIWINFLSKGLSACAYDDDESSLALYAKMVSEGVGEYGFAGAPTLDLLEARYAFRKNKWEARPENTGKTYSTQADYAHLHLYPEFIKILDHLSRETNELAVEIGQLIEKGVSYKKQRDRWKQLMNTLSLYLFSKNALLEMGSPRLDPKFHGEEFKAVPYSL